MDNRCARLRWAPTLKPSHLETGGKEGEKSHAGHQHDCDNKRADDYKFFVFKLLLVLEELLYWN